MTHPQPDIRTEPEGVRPTGEPIRIVLADDHGAIRAGCRMIFSADPDLDVVGEAADGAAAIMQARALRPDVVLMDIRMPGADGIDATRQIRAEDWAEVLILTTFDIDDYLVGALRSGACGFLLKSAEPDELIAAVRRAAAGDGVLAPELTRRVLTDYLERRGVSNATRTGIDDQLIASAGTKISGLTEREREVLAALGRGLSNADLAAELVISEKTVKTHVSRVLAKLGCRSRMQAAFLARETGLG